MSEPTTPNAPDSPLSTPSPHAESPGDAAIIDARLAELTARFGDQLSDEQVSQVRARLGRTVALARTLRTLPLTNADEPEIVFVPYRGDGER